MKILYDYAAFLMQSHGGVSRIMCEVIKRELVRRGVEAQVYAGFHKNSELQQLSRQFPGKIRGQLLPPMLAKQRVFLPINRALFGAFSKRFAPDICHYTFFQTPPVPPKTKVVITVHDLIGEIFHRGESDPQILLRRAALERADGIICVSENTKKDLSRFYDVGTKPVLVAYHGNSLRNVVPVVAEVTFPFFLYVGTRAAAYKNFHLLLKAFSNCPQLNSYRIICFGGGDFTSSERATIKAAGLENRVVYQQGDDVKLAGFYQRAKALIYPSLYEGFGLPPIEAMGLGCPVLASSAPPMPEIIGDAALFFDPDSPAQLLTAISRLLAEPGLRENLIRRGREQELRYCWEKTAVQIHDFYLALLASREA